MKKSEKELNQKLKSSHRELEQAELTWEIQALEDFISEATEESLNVESFLNLVKKYTEIKEPDAEIIRTFVDKIYVEQSQKIEGSRTKKQTIWIQWNYIGVVNINKNTEKIGITSISTNHADNFLRN